MAIDTPNWVKSAVIYEVFPRNHTNDGTFAGIYRDLERIRNLHTDILWLMPIHPVGKAGRKGTFGSPYAIRDYCAIDPELGDERSFRMLVDKAHALGMKVMLDVVHNHTSRITFKAGGRSVII
ncbi:MAG: alpha-amylase family glycosyl hydrolase [Bacillota bacterium]